MRKIGTGEWRWIVVAGLALTAAFFARGCIGRVPSPTGLIYHWYPWSETATEAAKGRVNPILFDGAVQVYPWYLFARDEIRSGRLPLWNPYAACGIPHAANPVTAVFSPFSIPLWVLPLSLALLIVHGAKVFLAWTFMALYLRHRGLPFFESLIGALAFALSGYVVLWLFWHHSSTFLWLPLLFLLADRVMEGGRGRDVILLGIVSGLCLLSGHVETAFHNGVALGCYAGAALIWRVVRGRVGISAAALAAARLILAAILGVALSAVVILPFLEYLGESHVLQVRTEAPANIFWYLPSWSLGLLVPNFFGAPGAGEYWFPGGTYIEIGQGYFGVIPFVLFLMGAALAFLRRDAFGIGLAILSFACIGVAFGIPPFFHLVAALPGFRLSANNRMLALTVFGGVVLGATALQVILARKDEDRSRIVWAAIAAGGALLFVLVLFPFAAVRRPENLTPGALSGPVWFAGPPRWIATHLLLCVALAGSFFLMLGMQMTGRISGAWFRRILAVLVLGDLAWFSFGFNPMVPPREIYPSTEVTDLLGPKEGGPARILGTPARLPVGTSLPYRIPDIRGYDGMGIARYERIRDALAERIPHLDHGEIWDPGLLDFLGVRFLLREPPGGVERQWPVALDHPEKEMLPDESLGQTFVAQEDGLEGVAFFLGTFRRRNQGALRFRLLAGGPDGTEVRAGEVRMEEIGDNRWQAFRFPPLRRSGGKRYYAYIDAPDAFPGNAVTAWVAPGDVYPHGTLVRSGEAVPDKDLCFRTLTAGRLGEAASGLPIHENEYALPSAYLVREVILVDGGADSIARIRERKVDYRSQVIIERPLPGSMTPEDLARPLPEEAEEGRVRVISYLPTEVTIEIGSNPAPAVLVMSDTYYPGWEAVLDDDEVPILLANHAFRAVPVGEGDHTLVFRFRPPSTRWGLAISLLAALVAGAFLVIRRAGPRRISLEVPGTPPAGPPEEPPPPSPAA